VSDLQRARRFYSEEIGLPQLADPNCRADEEACYGLGTSTRVDLFKGSGGLTDSVVGESSLGEVTLLTDDIRSMRKFLDEHSVHNTGVVELAGSNVLPNKRYSLTTADPDGHRIGFVQYAGCVTCLRSHTQQAPSSRILHAGFVVRNKIGMDQFYEHILGFKPYWHGGMKDDQTDWESFQVPDGTDWIEFMVNVPENADPRLRGIMNHIALGVPDIHEAQRQLLKNGVHLTEEPKIGRDGKWQLNVYDPDLTRIEFMEFTPKEKPCCSEFTGPHPRP
jgi:catechol 2,3-dioxygenase-like lactoylglutathione lyase family enzyme